MCLLAAGSALCPMAICPAQCSAPLQQPASAGGRHIKARAFSSIRVGSNMKHVHTFGCPVFTLQNELASGKSLPRWSPRVRLGLNLGPNPMHARNVYMVLNLITGCVSTQYHCCFDNFFKTTRHGGPDVSDTICWQQLAGLDCATAILLEVSTPTPHSVKCPETPSEGDVLPEELPFVPPAFDVTSDDHSVSDGDSQISENVQLSHQSQALLQPEGVTPIETSITARTSQRGRVCTMSRRIAESIAQGMHHVARQSTIGETDEDLFHDAHLDLQERMRNPVAFHAEMMGDIMYLQQALRQPDAKEFVQAVVKEVNGHVDSNNWTLKKRDEVPDDTQIVPSVWSMRRKRDLTTNQVKSHKARLNLHGRKQV
jgi:hypothetical protein